MRHMVKQMSQLDATMWFIRMQSDVFGSLIQRVFLIDKNNSHYTFRFKEYCIGVDTFSIGKETDDIRKLTEVLPWNYCIFQ